MSSLFRTLSRTTAIVLLAACAVPFALGDAGPLRTDPPKGITVDELIQAFAAKEKQFKDAREHYTWTQDVKVDTLDGDTVDGEYRQTSDILFDDQGRRVEQVTYAPMDTLQRVSITKEDLDDIRNRLPFVLTSDDLAQYQILYVGQQKQDELDTYVFDVAPKTMEKGKRYFQGRIWVDQQDKQIVLTSGRNVPDVHKKGNENLTPAFVTYREQVDGKYWFPTYTRADDTLHFSNQDVHIREIVKYTNYKRFGSDTKIIFNGETVDQPKDQPNPPKQ